MTDTCSDIFTQECIKNIKQLQGYTSLYVTVTGCSTKESWQDKNKLKSWQNIEKTLKQNNQHGTGKDRPRIEENAVLNTLGKQII